MIKSLEMLIIIIIITTINVLIFTLKYQNKTICISSFSIQEESTWMKELHVLDTTTRSPVPCSHLQLSHSNIHQKEPASLQGICSTAAFLHTVCKSKEDGKAGSKHCLLPWINHGTMENVGSDSGTPFLLCVKTVIWIVQVKISHKLEQALLCMYFAHQ